MALNFDGFLTPHATGLVPCQARSDVSCLSFYPPAALRLRLHSDAMRPQLRLAGRQNYFAILRHFLLDMTLGGCPRMPFFPNSALF